METQQELVCIVWSDEPLFKRSKDVAISYLTEYPGVIRTYEPDNIDPRVGQLYWPKDWPEVLAMLAKGDGARVAVRKSWARKLMSQKDAIPFADEFYG